MRKRAVLMLTVVIALGVAGSAQATLPSGIAVTTFVRAPISATGPHQGVRASAGHVKLLSTVATDVAVQTITSPPGASSGWHSHPGIVLVAVQSGTCLLYTSDAADE